MADSKKFGDAIKGIMEAKDVSQADLASMLGYKSQSGVAEMLNRPESGTSTDKLIAICNILGYEVVLQPIKKGRREAGQIVLERSDPTAPASATTRPRTVKEKKGDAE